MASFFRNVKKGLRRLFSVKTVCLDGIVLSTDLAYVSTRVRNEVFKEIYEGSERILVSRALGRGDRVLEVGGGVGYVSLVCAKACGTENVLIYEPNPKMERVIRLNFQLNGLVPQLRSKAVTANGKDVEFFINENIISSSVYERDGSTKKTLPADALDEVIAEWHPTAIVMDAEGAEVDMLAASPLAGVSKLILELHPHIVGEAAIQKLKQRLNDLGFKEQQSVRKSAYFLRTA